MHALAPEVAPARSWARFPSHWCHGIMASLGSMGGVHTGSPSRETLFSDNSI